MPNYSTSKTSCSSPALSRNVKSIAATPLLPKTWFKWGHYMRLAIASLLLVLAISGCITSNKAEAAQWREASSITSNAIASQVVSENTSMSLKEVKPLAFVTSLPENNKLVIFDFNSTQLCGLRRCTYVAYEIKGEQARRVWQEHLNPNLPPAIHLFSIAANSSSGQPCLMVNQVEGNNIRQSKFCYNGRQIEEAENRLLEKQYK